MSLAAIRDNHQQSEEVVTMSGSTLTLILKPQSWNKKKKIQAMFNSLALK